MGVRGILVCEELEPAKERVSVEVIQPARRRKVARVESPPGGKTELLESHQLTQSEVEENLATLHECLQMATRLDATMAGNKAASVEAKVFHLGEDIGRRK